MTHLFQRLPELAHMYCRSLLEARDVEVRLHKPRSTKLGYFKADHRNKHYKISLNRDLSPFTCLITLLHEMAHYDVATSNSHRTTPHGSAWKAAFQKLMYPMLTHQVLPEPLLTILKKHMQNPRASLAADPNLWEALRQFNPDSSLYTLNAVPDGQTFTFKNKVYKRIKLRRTRVLCEHQYTGKHYLIHGLTEISRVS